MRRCRPSRSGPGSKRRTGSGSTRRPCAARSASSRSAAATASRRRRSSTSSSGRRRSGATRCALLPGRTSRRRSAGFDGATEFDLPVECTYDFEVAAAKYLHALGDGEIPLILLFSGTVFTKGTTGFAAVPLSWSSEASYRLPVSVWRSTMDAYYPGQRVHPPRARHAGRPAAVQGPPAGCRRGTRRSPSCSRKPRRGCRDGGDEDDGAGRRGGGGRPLRHGEGGGRRGPLRGVRALPVSSVVGEEPGALPVGRADAAGLLRGGRLGAVRRPGPSACWRPAVGAGGGRGRPARAGAVPADAAAAGRGGDGRGGGARRGRRLHRGRVAGGRRDAPRRMGRGARPRRRPPAARPPRRRGDGGRACLHSRGWLRDRGRGGRERRGGRPLRARAGGRCRGRCASPSRPRATARPT